MKAIVTGAARGLGAAIAARFARDGAAVALVDVNPAVAETAEDLARGVPGARILALAADVADEHACEDAVARAAEFLGGVDALVNNAGIGGPDTHVLDTPLAEFRRVLEVNLGSAFLASRAAARVMVGQGDGGAIVNLGSVYGQQGVAGGGAYCASKGGVALLTHTLAMELAPHRIRVNTIAPGNMATQMHWDDLRARAAQAGRPFKEQVQVTAAAVPLGRHGTGDDIAGTVAWLVSADAAYVTGQTIGVNGGIWLS